MTNLFKDLPLKSPEDIINSVYERNEKSKIEALECILNKDMSIKEFVNSLDKEDELTNILYDRTKDGKYIYPSINDENSKEKAYIGSIGIQDDLYHKESLSENVKATLFNLDEDYKKNKDLNRNGMQLITIFSNVGKKYTARTAELLKGVPKLEYPGANKLSAYIAARKFKDMGLDKSKALGAVAVIYNQDKYRNKWNEKDKEKNLFKTIYKQSPGEKFIEKYGKETEKMLSSLNRANKGFVRKQDIRDSYNVISQGNAILERSFNGKNGINRNKPFKKEISQLNKSNNIDNIGIMGLVSENNREYELNLKEAKKKKERLKQIRDNKEYAKQDKFQNEVFLKCVEKGINFNLLMGVNGSLMKKAMLERIKDKGKEKGIER